GHNSRDQAEDRRRQEPRERHKTRLRRRTRQGQREQRIRDQSEVAAKPREQLTRLEQNEVTVTVKPHPATPTTPARPSWAGFHPTRGPTRVGCATLEDRDQHVSRASQTASASLREGTQRGTQGRLRRLPHFVVRIRIAAERRPVRERRWIQSIL